MSYLVLARKWRPQTFEEVVGQAHATRTLQNAISTGRVGHGYLFTGPRGVGKTSTARILAKALNCAKGPTANPCGECDACREVVSGSNIDVIEIDGASNNSVDDIRDLREKVLYGGARDRYKVYIIDEVHMLTAAAFNALLKTLEEPPSHVIFIFATTEAHKVPATILSRTQRFDFRRIGARELTGQLKKILDAEGVASTPEALALVARAAGGSMRDAQTLLDQVISFASGKAISGEDVLQVLGGVQESQALAALKSSLEGKAEPAFAWVRELYERGADFRLALEALAELLRGLMLLQTAGAEAASDAGLLPETVEALGALSSQTGLSRTLAALRAASEAESQMRFSSNPRLALELFLARLSSFQSQGSIGELFDELVALEKRVRAMPASASASAPAPVPAPLAPAAVESEPAAPAPPDAPPAVSAPAVISIEEAPAPSSLSLETLKDGWERVVERCANVGLMLGTCVRDAELAALERGELVLKVRNPRQKDTLEDPGSRAAVEEALRECFQASLKVKVLYSPAPLGRAAKAEAPKPSSSGKPGPEELERLQKEIPQLKFFQEKFGAEVIDIKKH